MQVRFILALINETLVIKNKPKKTMLTELRAKGFTPFPKKRAHDHKDTDEVCVCVCGCVSECTKCVFMYGCTNVQMAACVYLALQCV